MTTADVFLLSFLAAISTELLAIAVLVVAAGAAREGARWLRRKREERADAAVAARYRREAFR